MWVTGWSGISRSLLAGSTTSSSSLDMRSYSSAARAARIWLARPRPAGLDTDITKFLDTQRRENPSPARGVESYSLVLMSNRDLRSDDGRGLTPDSPTIAPASD